MLELTDTIGTMAAKMSKGNFGALRVVTELLADPDGFLTILHADDMNLRGPKLWLAYKDLCDMSIQTLSEKLRARDAALVDYVNLHDPNGEPAVTGGASYNRR